MRCTLGTVSVAALVLIVGTAFWPQHDRNPAGPVLWTARAEPKAKEPVDKKDPADQFKTADVDPDDRVNQILDRERTTLDFSETPVTEALEFLSERLEVDIVKCRDLSGVLEDVYSKPVTLSVRNTQLTGRAALQLVLEQVGLSYVVRDGLILVRTPESALTVAMIDVQPLLIAEGNGKGEHLVDTIEHMVQPASWVDSGGLYGTIGIFNDLLIVRHTPEAVREVREFVQQLHDESLKLGRVK
jgi:hypothetical protein